MGVGKIYGEMCRKRSKRTAARRYHAASFARSCLRRARCATRGVHRARGRGTRSFTSKRTKNPVLADNADRRTFPLFVITARQEARARVAWELVESRDEERNFMTPLPQPVTSHSDEVCRLVSLELIVFLSSLYPLRLQVLKITLLIPKQKKIGSRSNSQYSFWENIVSFYSIILNP